MTLHWFSFLQPDTISYETTKSALLGFQSLVLTNTVDCLIHWPLSFLCGIAKKNILVSVNIVLQFTFHIKLSSEWKRQTNYGKQIPKNFTFEEIWMAIDVQSTISKILYEAVIVVGALDL